VIPRHGGPVYRLVKRSLDIVIASALLVTVAPLLLVIAVLIALDEPRGPIIFRQRRCGQRGRSFYLYKFRTMAKDADALKEQLRALSSVSWPDFRLENDPRVTRIGRFLRRSSLDELPQLLNVIRGDMALVGPRPTSFSADTYDLWHTGRLDFRPGLTGPWQVWGRDSMDFNERCRLEISYFRRPSLLRDLRILVATVGVLVRRTGVA
jgi:lipopolysaccharide/colanic/teichoic acid biosynthesis glycosyltransferase